MPSCESESGGESGWVIRSSIACHDITTNSVNIKYTGGMLVLTFLLLGNGSIAFHDITMSGVSIEHTRGTVMLTFIHMLDGSSVACHDLTASGVSIEHNGGMVMIILFHMLSGCPTTACGHWFGDWARPWVEVCWWRG